MNKMYTFNYFSSVCEGVKPDPTDSRVTAFHLGVNALPTSIVILTGMKGRLLVCAEIP